MEVSNRTAQPSSYKAETSHRRNQCERILELLRGANGQWVPLPRILDLRISQYSARIFTLRREGHQIENKTQTVDGRRHSWFRLSWSSGLFPSLKEAMVRSYGKIHTAFWTSAHLRPLSPEAKLLAAYLLSGPHSNMIGCFRLPHGYASEDLNLDTAKIAGLMAELQTAGFAEYDSATQLAFVPRFLKFNAIENPNQAKAAATLAATIPSNSPFASKLMQAFREHAPGVVKLLSNGSGNGHATLPQPFRNQEQEEEQEEEQDQKQEQEAGPATGPLQTVETVENDCSTTERPAASAIDFPLKDGDHMTITPDTIARWGDLFPELKVDRELATSRGSGYSTTQ